MRDKFSELIKQGVAEFNYTPISKDVPEMDPICRMYNNIFAIPSDTHMNCLEDGRRVITGHMINTDKWCMFVQSCCWGAVDFRTSGTWSVCDFLFRNGLEGKMGTLNGDVVYFVTPMSEEDRKALMKNQVITTESNIPMPITVLTTTGDMMHIKECFDCNDIKETVRRMNESTRVIGNNWVPTETGIAGLVGNKVYIIGDVVNEAHEYRRYSMQIDPFKDNHTDGIKLTVFDRMFDKHWYATIDGSGKVTYCSEYVPGRDKTFVADKFLGQLEDNDFDWAEEFAKDLSLHMAYEITMKGPYEKSGWKVKKYPGYEIFFGVTSIGQLKKRTR